MSSRPITSNADKAISDSAGKCGQFQVPGGPSARVPGLRYLSEDGESMVELEKLPLISILTPSLNSGSHIAEAIDSVRAQNYPKVEHLVLDAGSTDDTPEVLARYPHLSVIREADESAHEAMNKGLKLARGEVIGFLNSDDTYAEGVLLKVGRRFAADPELDMLCGGDAVFERDLMGAKRVLLTRNRLGDGLVLAELTLGAPAFNARFYRRRLFDRLGGFELHFLIAADRDFLIRAALSHTRSAALPRTLYYYRRHEGSRTLNPARRHTRDIAREHATIAEARLDDDGLASGDRRRLAAWHAYECVKLAVWELAGLRLGSGLCWLVRAGRHSAFWPWSVMVSLWRKFELAHGPFFEARPPDSGRRGNSG